MLFELSSEVKMFDTEVELAVSINSCELDSLGMIIGVSPARLSTSFQGLSLGASQSQLL